jgi:hypothetical protein
VCVCGIKYVAERLILMSLRHQSEHVSSLRSHYNVDLS